MPVRTWLTVTNSGPDSAPLFTSLKEVDGVRRTRIELILGRGWVRRIMPDTKTRLREQ